MRLKSPRRRSYRSLVVCLAIIWVNWVNGQFVYFSVGASSSSHKFTSDSKYTAYNNEYAYTANFHAKKTSLDLGVLWRPLRILGAGFQVGVPIAGSTRGNIITGIAAGNYGRWEVQENKYDLSSGISIRGNVRFFVERKVNLYGDISVGTTRLSERFTLTRQYAAPASPFPELEPLNIDESRSYNMVTPGIQLGVMPHVAKHIFLDFYVRMDMINHPESSLRYDIIGAWDFTNNVEVVNPAVSPLQGNTYWAMTVGFGAGYFF